MNLDPALLARIQFGFSFHIIFPTISIGLAMFLAIVEGLWLKNKDPLYLQIYRFWLGIFAMAFGVGVVTGIVLSFEFGLAFARFGQMPASRKKEVRTSSAIIGPIAGPRMDGKHDHALSTPAMVRGPLSGVACGTDACDAPDPDGALARHLTTPRAG